jgi:uncharacterized protein
MLKISKSEAKNIIIGLQLPRMHSSSLDTIQRLGYIQIDTLSVAARSHHHILQTRNKHYVKTDLDNMMSNKQVFEYWSHAASYLPMENYRYSLLRKQKYAKGELHWFPKNKKMEHYVLDRINAEGPLQSKDFKDTRDAASEWYDWKPTKIALEQLFIEGKLMVCARKNFHKVYNLTERVLPKGINTSTPSLDEYSTHLIKSALTAQGIATSAEISYLRKGIKPTLLKSLNKLVVSGEVELVKIENLREDYYALNVSPDYDINSGVYILSPFDNLIIQRKRLLSLFDFDYQLECYVPAAKRKFGYYCLPILFGDKFVGRLDPKADRKTNIFTVKNLWFEPDFVPNEDFYECFSEKLIGFANFCGCTRIIIEKCSPRSYKVEVENTIENS